MPDLNLQASVVIDRPIIEVFDKVCDSARAASWVPFCEHSEIIAAATGAESHNGVGKGMRARFRFEFTGKFKLAVQQDVTEFDWGRLLTFTTTRLPDDELAAADPVTQYISTFIPRTIVNIQFEAGASGTVVTLNVAIWVTAFAGADVVRPFASDSLLQALTRLKSHVEFSPRKRLRPWIFFNYRRVDSEFAADRVYDGLRREFGEDAIFRDIVHLQAGDRFLPELENKIISSRVFLAIIGDRWMREREKRHASSGRDILEHEILTALTGSDGRAPFVIPVLIGDTRMPSFPADDPLTRLSDQHAIHIRREPLFDRDMRTLIDLLWERHRVASGGADRQIGAA